MRRTKEITIEAEGRDKGKKFLITEMSSFAAEKWAARAFNMILASGMEMPDGAANAGMAGLAGVAGSMVMSGFNGLPWNLVEPLLDEMMTCVSVCVPIRPEPGRPTTFRGLLESAEDIEEVVTRLQLRKEIMELHLGFTWADFLQKRNPAAQAVGSESGVGISLTQSA